MAGQPGSKVLPPQTPASHPFPSHARVFQEISHVLRIFQETDSMKRSSTQITVVPDSNPRARKTFKSKTKTRQAMGIQSQIHRPLATIKPELKWNDIPVANAPPPFGGWTAGQNLTNLAVGGGSTNRVGRKVNWTKFNMRSTFNIDQGSNPTGGCCIRQVVVYDKQTNGVAPTALSVFAVDDFTSQMNLDNRDRFIILMDTITEGLSLGNMYNVQTVQNRKFNCETIYNAGVLNTVADINTGAIYYFASQSNAIFGVNIQQNTRFRMRFVDY